MVGKVSINVPGVQGGSEDTRLKIRRRSPSCEDLDKIECASPEEEEPEAVTASECTEPEEAEDTAEAEEMDKMLKFLADKLHIGSAANERKVRPHLHVKVHWKN